MAERLAGTPDPEAVRGLRLAFAQLAARLDRAGLYRAAVYAALAGDAIGDGAPDADGDLRTDVELGFERDEHGRVWMIRDGDCHLIGRTNAVCGEMRRFLAAAVLGEEEGDGR